jgi:hypothetical protein
MEPSKGKQAAFAVALAAYYVVYGMIFGARVAEYFRDLFRHFEFVRRFY